MSNLRRASSQAATLLFNIEQESGPGANLSPDVRATCREVRLALDAAIKGHKALTQGVTDENR